MVNLPLPAYDGDDQADANQRLSQRRRDSPPGAKTAKATELDSTASTPEAAATATDRGAVGHKAAPSRDETLTPASKRKQNASASRAAQHRRAALQQSQRSGESNEDEECRHEESHHEESRHSTREAFNAPARAPRKRSSRAWPVGSRHDSLSTRSIAALLTEPSTRADGPIVLPPLRTQRSFSYADLHAEGYTKDIPPDETSQERSDVEGDSQTRSSSSSPETSQHYHDQRGSGNSEYSGPARSSGSRSDQHQGHRRKPSQDRHVHMQDRLDDAQHQHQHQHEHKHERPHERPHERQEREHADAPRFAPKRRLSPMQPQVPPQTLPPLSSRPDRMYDAHRHRWEPPYLPPVGPQFGHDPAYWPPRDRPGVGYGSPTLGSRFSMPQPPFPLRTGAPLPPPRPPPEGSYYASPRPRPPPFATPYSFPPGPRAPVGPYAAHPEPARAATSPSRVDKQVQASARSRSQRHARPARSRRRRHGSRHGDSMDARISSVALITPSYDPSVSLDTRALDSQLRPPGGWYWAVMSNTGSSDNDDADSNGKESPGGIMLPIQMCQPPLRDIMPPYPQALEADPQPRLRKQSKYTAQQDRLILELKSKGETWAEIAAKADCQNQLAARNRYQVLIGQQGSGTFFWTEEDCAALQSALDEAERAKWLFLAQELSRKRGRQFSLDAVHLKVAQMFAAHPETFGVIKTHDSSRGGAPYKRKLLEEG